jgi:uncharacterized membrane protein (DUF106 family)
MLTANDYGVIAFVVMILIIGAILYGAKRAIGKLILTVGAGGVFTLVSYFVLIFTGIYDNVRQVLNPTPALNVFAIIIILFGLGIGYYAVKKAKVKA